MDFKEIIKRHLDKMAASDFTFAERYKREDKSIDDCVKYIYSMAKKQTKSGGTWFEDAVVFGWAVHYYQEDTKDIKKDVDNAPKGVKTGYLGGYKPKDVTSTKVKKMKAVVNVKDKDENNKCVQLDLFGGF